MTKLNEKVEFGNLTYVGGGVAQTLIQDGFEPPYFSRIIGLYEKYDGFNRQFFNGETALDDGVMVMEFMGVTEGLYHCKNFVVPVGTKVRKKNAFILVTADGVAEITDEEARKIAEQMTAQ